MMLGRLLVAAICLAAGAAAAETVRVRSGEHAGFSRLVLPLGRQAEWDLRRDGDGYRFRILSPTATIDAGDIFRLIPRRRIADATVPADRNSLTIALGCDCHATAFAMDDGTVVVDVADGKPAPGSPFEREAEAGPAADVPDRVAVAAPVLPSFWKRMTEEPTRPALPALAVEPTAAPDAATVPLALAGPPDDRTADMRRILDWQVSRAMAQGLVDPGEDWTGKRPPDAPAPEAAASEPSASTAAETGTPGTARGADLPMQAETALDSHLAVDPARQAEPAPSCPSPESLAVHSWATAPTAAETLTDARTDLVGEFDRPDAGRVIALARSYVHLGFGAEAALTLRAFPVDDADSLPLAEIARMADGLPPLSPETVATWAGCGDDGALWATIGSADALADREAVLRAFARLPPHLRQIFAPDLAAGFLAQGDAAAARVIQDAVLRADEGHDQGARLVQLRIAVESGQLHEALALADPLLREPGPTLPQAALLAQQAHLGLGQTVPPSLTELLAALGFEYRTQPEGAALLAAHAVSLATAGQFGPAFAALKDLSDPKDAEARDRAARAVFAALAERADDGAFALHYFAERDQVPVGADDAALRLAVASRLSELGFLAEAEGELGEMAATPEGLAILGRGPAPKAAGPDAMSPPVAKGPAPAAERPDATEMPDTTASQAAGAPAGISGASDDPSAAPATPDAAAPLDRQAPPPAGPLTAGKALLDQSRARRADLESLLKQSEAEAAAAPAADPASGAPEVGAAAGGT